MKTILAKTKGYIVALLVALVVVVWGLFLGSRPVSTDDSPTRVVIAKGTTAQSIAEILHENELIRSPFIFRLTTKVSGASATLKPGVYDFNQTMSVPEIIADLQKGRTVEVWVTIPEGFTAREIADRLVEKNLVNDEAFLRLAITQGYEFPSYGFIYGHNLEGYLFPDTYLIARGSDPSAIICKMLDTFEKKVVVPNRLELEETIKKRFGLGEDSFAEGLHKIITLASLVEREARLPDERPMIAAVMWNRFERNMRLEVDATVTYVPGESRSNKKRVLYRDLESNSPYNTYRNAGLPPAPIANPGLASIKAVLNPADVDYLFYVARKDGSHAFSRTFEEHKRKKAAIRNGR